MAKKILQDIIKVKNYSDNQSDKKIEKISYKEREFSRIVAKDDSDYSVSQIRENNIGPRYGLWFVALFAVVFLLFAVSFLFSGAKVTISPKTEDLVLNQNLNAIKDSSNDNDLSFDLVTIAGQETKAVQGGEAKDVVLKANGTVIIYNAFSSFPQTFSMNTRLEGSNGKIYKTEVKN